MARSVTPTIDLRETPRFDRTHWPQHWHMQNRYMVADFFSGRGGVGRALADWYTYYDYVGVDIEPYHKEYPGQFIQADLLGPQGPPFDGVVADVIWVSFPCLAYTPLSATAHGSREAALEANPRITDELREWLLNHAAHYVIENVPGASRAGDLDANCRCNGLYFGADYDLERHFETTFEVPDAYRDGDASITVDTRDDQSIKELADAKGVPASWGKSGVRSAIPREYVYWLLAHCPSVPCPAPAGEQSTLAGFGDGVGRHKRLPGKRLGGTKVTPGDELHAGATVDRSAEPEYIDVGITPRVR